MLCHYLVLALPLAKLHKRNLLLRDEAFQRHHKASGHGGQQGCRWQGLATMIAKEPYNSLLGLQPRHVDIEIHPTDTFDRKLDMMLRISATLCGIMPPAPVCGYLPLEG